MQPPLTGLIDSHCHLDVDRFDGERAQILQRARAAGVERMITIGCDVENSRRALGIANTHHDVFASVGVHPHEAEGVTGDFVAQLQALSDDPRCVAIGECGLDYYYDNSPRDQQREVFAKQIRLAREVQKPLVVHVRDAWDDALAMLESDNAASGVIHCFTSHWQHAKRALDFGFYISIPGIVTFTKAEELREVVPKLPIDRLLVETDSPFLAPRPHRGKRNEPAFVRHTAECVAQLRGMSIVELEKRTSENARALFGL